VYNFGATFELGGSIQLTEMLPRYSLREFVSVRESCRIQWDKRGGVLSAGMGDASNVEQTRRSISYQTKTRDWSKGGCLVGSGMTAAWQHSESHSPSIERGLHKCIFPPKKKKKNIYLSY